MIKSIQFTGGFFGENTSIELFNNADSVQLAYGKNGTGKSTISKAIQKAKGDLIPDIASAILYDENEDEIIDTSNIHVFNENYINNKIKIRTDGLDTILLIGDLVGIEDKIAAAKKNKEELIKRKEDQRVVCEKYKNADSPESPLYFANQIDAKLSGDNNWAGREKLINAGKKNSVVTDSVKRAIKAFTIEKTEQELRDLYNEKLSFLNRIRGNNNDELESTFPLTVNFEGERIRTSLAKVIEKPELSEREKYLFSLVENGNAGVEQMKKTFSDSETHMCPFCLQPVSDDYKRDLVESIQKVLSKAVDEHKEELRKLIIQAVSVDLSYLEILSSTNLDYCKKCIEAINSEIARINADIERKINNPYVQIKGFSSNLSKLLNEYEEGRKRLENDIKEYNEALSKPKLLISELSDINKQIARIEIKDSLDALEKTLELQKKDEEKNADIENELIKSTNELDQLNSQKKNISIAKDQINCSLRYVFFSKDRLEIKVKNDKYCLYSYGRPVKPENVSVGERNIIALCYFFTELLSDHEVKDGYAQRMIVVIDDPVSSFDFENKVGIMSLLKSKMSNIMTNNYQSQIMIFTHDMQCMFDMQKICDEVCEECGKKITYSTRELVNKNLGPFNKRKNEYTELVQIIYRYAIGELDNYDLVIGNVMRRTLEAFSTFLYKLSIEKVSCDESILSIIDDEDYIEYFKNLMYRLVLHGESHMEERVKAAEDIDYLEFMSQEAKQRTAKEVLCFMYLLNERHVKAHLQGMKNYENNLKEWCKEIKEFQKEEIIGDEAC